MLVIDEQRFWEEVKKVSHYSEYRAFQDGGTVKEETIDLDCLKEILDEVTLNKDITYNNEDINEEIEHTCENCFHCYTGEAALEELREDESFDDETEGWCSHYEGIISLSDCEDCSHWWEKE